MSEVITEQNAAARKDQDAATMREQHHLLGDTDAPPLGRWTIAPPIFENGLAAAEYLNRPPAQGTGDVTATFLDDGKVRMLVYWKFAT